MRCTDQKSCCVPEEPEKALVVRLLRQVVVERERLAALEAGDRETLAVSGRGCCASQHWSASTPVCQDHALVLLPSLPDLVDEGTVARRMIVAHAALDLDAG